MRASFAPDDPSASDAPRVSTRRAFLRERRKELIRLAVALGLGDVLRPAFATPGEDHAAGDSTAGIRAGRVSARAGEVSFPCGYYTFPEIAKRLAPNPEMTPRCDPALTNKVALICLKPRPREEVLRLLEAGLDITLETREKDTLYLTRAAATREAEASALDGLSHYLNRAVGGPLEALFPFQGTDLTRWQEALPTWEAAVKEGTISAALKESPAGQRLAAVVETRAREAGKTSGAEREGVWLEVAGDWTQGVQRGRGAQALAALWRSGRGAPGASRIAQALAERWVIESGPPNTALNRPLQPELAAGLDTVVYGLDLPYYGDVAGYGIQFHLSVCTPDREETPLAQWQFPLFYRDADLYEKALGKEARTRWDDAEKRSNAFLDTPLARRPFMLVNRNYPVSSLKFCHVLEDWTRATDSEIIAEQYPTLQKAYFFAGSAAVNVLNDAFSAITLRDYPKKTPYYPADGGDRPTDPPPASAVTWTLRDAFTAVRGSAGPEDSGGEGSGERLARRNPLTLEVREGVLLVTNRWAFADRRIAFPDASLLQVERLNTTDGFNYGTYPSYYASVTPAQDALWERYAVQEAPRSLLKTTTLSSIRLLHEALLALPVTERERALRLPMGEEYRGVVAQLGEPAVARLATYCRLRETGWRPRLWHARMAKALAPARFRFSAQSHLGRLTRRLFIISDGAQYNFLGGGDFVRDAVSAAPPTTLTMRRKESRA